MYVHEAGKTQLRKLYLGAGLLSVRGSADLDANENLNGRLAIDLKSPTFQAHSSLAVSGTLKAVQFSR
jgi:hypothetical protein